MTYAPSGAKQGRRTTRAATEVGIERRISPEGCCPVATLLVQECSNVRQPIVCPWAGKGERFLQLFVLLEPRPSCRPVPLCRCLLGDAKGQAPYSVLRIMGHMGVLSIRGSLQERSFESKYGLLSTESSLRLTAINREAGDYRDAGRSKWRKTCSIKEPSPQDMMDSVFVRRWGRAHCVNVGALSASFPWNLPLCRAGEFLFFCSARRMNDRRAPFVFPLCDRSVLDVPGEIVFLGELGFVGQEVLHRASTHPTDDK